MPCKTNRRRPYPTSEFDAVWGAKIARELPYGAARGRPDGVTDVIHRRSMRSLLGKRDRCEIDLGIHGIQCNETLAQDGFLVVGDLHLAEGSLADADKGDSVGKVCHDVVKVRRLRSGRTSSDTRGHFGRALTGSPSRIGTAS